MWKTVMVREGHLCDIVMLEWYVSLPEVQAVLNGRGVTIVAWGGAMAK